jgi:aldehyde dehydrogenase (NAD+)
MHFLDTLGLQKINNGVSTGKNWLTTKGENLESYSPVDGALIGTVQGATEDDYKQVVNIAKNAFAQWRTWPAPKRGEVVRQIGDALRKQKEPLGQLVSYEMGKSLQEGLGEVQEMIDICDFDSYMDLPCIVNDLRIVCMSSGIH